ncbi:unnamed protein product [Leptidea sinapis]|uniref:Uncharacterized protein n=1 Tax=Leptidea sinapis TaxID=189913 RepID=A0A5E4QYZ2_9NEOP|nr:unnamed protein product [Leptidea sinapis]
MRGGPCARPAERDCSLALTRPRRCSRADAGRARDLSRVCSDVTRPKCSSQCSRSQPRECSSRPPSPTRPARRSGKLYC